MFGEGTSLSFTANTVSYRLQMPEVFSKKMEEHDGELKQLVTHVDSLASYVVLKGLIMLQLGLTLAKWVSLPKYRHELF